MDQTGIPAPAPFPRAANSMVNDSVRKLWKVAPRAHVPCRGALALSLPHAGYNMGNGAFTRRLVFSAKIRCMDVVSVARSLNRQAVQESWHHFCDPTLSFSDGAYDRLLALWRSKAAIRAMPRRSDITPRDLKDIMRHVVMWERFAENPSRYRWRLVGSAITDIAGHDTVGKSLEETIPPEHLARWVGCGDLVLSGGQPIRCLGRVHLKDREYLDAENLFVPLANDNDEPTFILGQCRYTPRCSESDDIWENQIASLPGGLL
jgi:hypothetical protein